MAKLETPPHRRGKLSKISHTYPVRRKMPGDRGYGHEKGAAPMRGSATLQMWVRRLYETPSALHTSRHDKGWGRYTAVQQEKDRDGC